MICLSCPGKQLQHPVQAGRALPGFYRSALQLQQRAEELHSSSRPELISSVGTRSLLNSTLSDIKVLQMCSEDDPGSHN